MTAMLRNRTWRTIVLVCSCLANDRSELSAHPRTRSPCRRRKSAEFCLLQHSAVIRSESRLVPSCEQVGGAGEALTHEGKVDRGSDKQNLLFQSPFLNPLAAPKGLINCDNSTDASSVIFGLRALRKRRCDKYLRSMKVK